MAKLGLVSMIEALKEELRELNDNPQTPYYFNIDGAEVELNVGVKAESSGGVNFWVIQLGGKVSKEHIHKVKIKLSLLEDEELDYDELERKYNVEIASKPPRIGGKAVRASRGRAKAARKRAKARK